MIDWDLSLSLKNTSIGSVNTIPLPNKKITDLDKDTCAKFTFIVEVPKVSI